MSTCQHHTIVLTNPAPGALKQPLKKPLRQQPGVETQLIGQSRALQDVLVQATRLIGRHANILITGESGTGKDLLAQFIHRCENNPARPFVAINCAAIPANLLESELFGHEQGSFTGASRRHLGKFEIADQGDLFLDEINSMPLEMQAKLLRVLQDKAFCRIGSHAPIKISCRIIAASNCNLDLAVKQEKFRHDLLYRLRVVHLQMPSLRERAEDIPRLIRHFLEKHAHNNVISCASDVVSFLCRYGWPGNVRELENVIHSAVIMCTKPQVTLEDLPYWLVSRAKATGLATQALATIPCSTSLSEVLELTACSYIKEIIARCQGNLKEAVSVLGISRSKLYATLKKVGAPSPARIGHEMGNKG